MQRSEEPVVLRDYKPNTGVTEWLAFPRYVEPERARAVFADIYGHRPAATQRRLPFLLVGPIPENEMGGDQ